MRNLPPDPVDLLEELALRVATRGRSALDVWRFVGVLVRIEYERGDYLAAMTPDARELFHDAKDSPLADFVGPIH